MLMNSKHSKLAQAVRFALVCGAVSSASFSANTLAAEEGADDQAQRITITGSRIKRDEFVANAPVASVGEVEFDMTNTINTESLLNTLPQVVPGLDRTSNNPGNGTATIDLRGLGTNRTLVLIDGTRAVASDSSMVVDINSIPTSLIKDVQVLTGGASAVYGSDAVAGVVNFILKDDFEGVEVGTSYEVTEQGDAAIFSTDFTLGGNFADGRGNVVFNISRTKRDPLFQGDRDFSFFAQFDSVDGNGNPILINGGSSGVPGTSIFSGGLCDFSSSCGVTFDSNGLARPFVTTGNNNDYYNYAPVNYIQLPQTRDQATVLGHYEFADAHEVYGRALFTRSKVPQQLAPTPIFQVAQFTLDGNPFIDPASQAVLSAAHGDGVDSDNDGIDDTATAFIRRRLVEVGPRIVDSQFTSYQFQWGVRGNIAGSNWDYDAYMSRGETELNFTQFGNVNRDRFQQALLLDLSDPTGGTCADPSANGSTVGCAPINIFGPGNISEAGAAFLRTAVAAVGELQQNIAAVTVTGDTEGMIELPGGPIGVAAGYEYIEYKSDFRPSQDLAAGTIAGFNGQSPIGGGYDVDSFFFEARLPILDGAEWADSLEAELAYRSSDYSIAGSTDASKISLSWAPVEQVRFRLGFNEAIRAPNIAELFAPQDEGFPGATDPCAANGPNAGDPAVAAICQATGVPAGNVFSPALNLPAGQVRALFGGNPDLKPEEAETTTYGVVWTPTDEFSVSLDYFNIEIDGAIANFGGGAANVLNSCYDPNNPNGGVGSDFCNVVNRRPDGTIEFVSLTLQNSGFLQLEGFDLIANYNREFMGGKLNIDYLATFTDKNDFLAFEGADVIECAGKFGLVCGEPIPEYKHRTTFRWTKDDLTVQFLWRYVGETTDDDDTVDYFVETLDGTNYFDTAVSYNITENFSITGGIDNLLDEDPPILGDNQEQANTYPATYDVFGRTYYVSLKATF